jgi:hypothetical protein
MPPAVLAAPCVFSVDGTDIPALGAALLEVDVAAGIAKFTGRVECDTLKANAMIAQSYTPGAGNVW